MSAKSQLPETSDSLGSSVPILEAFLSRAAMRGEQTVAIARLIFASLGLMRVLLFGGLAGLLAGEPKWTLQTIVLLVAIGSAVWILVRLRPGKRLVPMLYASVAVDAALLFSMGLGLHLWPSPTYPGFLRVPEAGLCLLGMATPGLRLSRRVALFGAALVGAGQLTLILLDAAVHSSRITYGASEYMLWNTLCLGSTVMGWTIAKRARELVFRGADAALAAERARQRLGLYVSEEVAREALASDALEVGGSRHCIAVLFSDLRDFTLYSEKLPPEQLVGELNEYLDAMMRVVRDHGGVVDKFIGDAIMAVFGLPVERPDDARRAVACARAMQEALVALNVRRAARGLPPLRQGIGVHAGDAVAGNIGNSERLQYTVVGSTVNLASRLEAACKTVGHDVVVSGEAAAAARAAGQPESELVALDSIEIRGHSSRVEIFTVGPAPQTTADRTAAQAS